MFDKQKPLVQMKRILSLNHNDLDGIAAALAVKLAHPNDHVVTEFCTIDSIYNRLLFALKAERQLPFDRIVLADISFKVPGDQCNAEWMVKAVNDELPHWIPTYVKKGGEFVVLDHHPSCLPVKTYYAQWLHEESICEAVDDRGVKRAGSELAGRYYARRRLELPMKTPELDVFDKLVLEFMALAGAYDTWRQEPAFDFEFGSKLAMAIDLMQDNRGAMEAMLNTLHLAYSDWCSGLGVNWQRSLAFPMAQYLVMAQERYDKELAHVRGTRFQHSKRVTEIFCPHFSSLISQEVYNETKGVVAIRFVSNRDRADRLSLRTHPDAGIDLGKFAKRFGGGGHPEAAGLPMTSDRDSEAWSNGVRDIETIIYELKHALGELD